MGYAVIGLMGVCLGLVGAGGSMLAVPVLVYLFRIEPTLATAYASIIVGATAASGAVKSLISRSVDLPSVLWFGLPCIFGAWFSRFCLFTFIPEVIVTLSSFNLTRDAFVVLLFSATMLLAGTSMLWRRNQEPVGDADYRWLPAVGLSVGIITGIVGAGGGFLILPSLILVAGLEVPHAVGTSLTIIAIKSMASLAGDLSAGLEIDFALVGTLSAAAVPGVLVGKWLSGHMKGSTIRTGFGVGIAIVGTLMGIHQLIVLGRH